MLDAREALRCLDFAGWVYLALLLSDFFALLCRLSSNVCDVAVLQRCFVLSESILHMRWLSFICNHCAALWVSFPVRHLSAAASFSPCTLHGQRDLLTAARTTPWPRRLRAHVAGLARETLWVKELASRLCNWHGAATWVAHAQVEQEHARN